ncbi:ABC transporter substrate-binding protein [Arthrobacter mobilis]|uniref:Sugar ABC transporter substrate-binding protein n=1 Tax=Arthrobacter mobilis TaxID=2724944 RepID=A0A7X6K3A4_9MICC|nr:sugar ABC transporter substrate-binding protein [Arthrobacter mobilis]NKX53305.1 sugar ABC transporter substrate-binding protein [Arthrobacter mobilis]
MKKSIRGAWGLSAAMVLAASLAACGNGGGGEGGEGGGGGGATGGSAGKIAFLMPDRASTRYEQQDSPLFKAKVEELCPDCEVLYQNADGDANKQQQQANAMITQGVKVLVLDPVDSTAAASLVGNAQGQGIKVVTYDRPVPDTPADFYVSFDNKKIGSLIAEDLIKHMASEGNTDGGLLMVNGSPTDRAAQLIKEGATEAVEASDHPILASYDTPEWQPSKAQDWVAGQITQFGERIDGVVAANDGTAGGAIAALKAAGVDPMPPVTGNDAEIAAIQRIIAGSQYNTISKPIRIVAEKSAEVAVQLLNGETPEADATLFETPSALFVPTVVTKDNVKEVIFDGGIYEASEVCTGEYKKGCDELDIQ